MMGKNPARTTYRWLLGRARPELFSCFLLILANILLACMGVAFALASKGVIDGATSGGLSLLWERSLIFLGIIAAQGVLQAYCRHRQAVIQGRLEIRFKSAFLESVLEKDYSEMMHYHSGDLLNRATSDVQAITTGLTSLLPTFSSLVTKIISAFGVLCVLDWRFSLIFAVAGTAMFVVTWFFRQRLKRLHKRVQESDGLVRSFLQEIFESFLVVRTFGVEKAMVQQGIDLQEDNYREKIKKNTFSEGANTGIQFIFNLGYLYALIWSCQGLITGAVSFGILTAVLQLVNQVQAPFVGLSGMLPQYYGALASAERMMEIEGMADEHRVNGAPCEVEGLYASLEGIVLREVCFSYNRDLIFDGASVTLKKGQCIVIGGISGIGKSTLLKLLIGVFIPDSGEVGLLKKDGELVAVDRYTRPLFAYVPQGNYLLSGTIRENIAFIRPEASDYAVAEAARLSCALDFINALPLGFETHIGEKGLGLSEGQVQRLAIARAILGGAPIMLLDEVTSALDGETERQVLKNIQSMMDRTCIIVTHKTAALSVCDAVVTIEGGRIEMKEIDNGKDG
ncbi:MAG: ABC transporter ATP-binding protein [Eubacterium sp.]